MMTAKTIFPAASAILCLTLATSQTIYAAPHLSQSDAANLAKNFGIRLTSLATHPKSTRITASDAAPKVEYHGFNSQYEANGLRGGSIALRAFAPLENKGRSYWKASRQGTSDIEIDDETGKIVAYTNYVTQDALNDEPAGEAISKNTALNIAKVAMAAAGQSTDTMKLEWVSEEQGHEPPIAAMHKISIAWRRTYQGIPFRKEGAGVILEGETGDVISVGIGCTSPDPVSVLENISQNQAVSIAESQLNAVSLSASNIPLMSVNKEIIHPNSYWITGKALQPDDSVGINSQTRVIWNCQFGAWDSYYEVCVDTETGDVIGGYIEESLGGSKKKLIPKFGYQLKHGELGLERK